MAVASLLPATTEILYALDVEPVGISHECDYPPETNSVPTITRSKIDSTGLSVEVNQSVRSAVETSNGVFEINTDVLQSVAPTLVITQGICEVCAVDTLQIKEAIDTLDLRTSVLTTDPHSWSDVLDDITRIGAVTQRTTQASALKEDLQDQFRGIQMQTEEISKWPTVAVLDWMDPVMVAGHWIPELVQAAGGQYPLAHAGARSRPCHWEEVLAEDPEVLIISPCGFGIEQIDRNIHELTENSGWNDLSAVRSGEVYIFDGNHYVNRPGPRLVDTLHAFAWCLHDEPFQRPDPRFVVPYASIDPDN